MDDDRDKRENRKDFNVPTYATRRPRKVHKLFSLLFERTHNNIGHHIVLYICGNRDITECISRNTEKITSIHLK